MIRTTEGFAQFFYRVNPNKTVDSICVHCFVASDAVANRDELKIWETAHRCSQWMNQSA